MTLLDSALFRAVLLGDIAQVKYCLAREASVNTQNGFNNPLHTATSQENFIIVDLLLNQGADANLKNICGETSLHLAARQGHQELVVLLLERRALVDSPGLYQRTPLHVAAFKGRESIVQLLLKQGSAIDQQDAYGNTPLHEATVSGYANIVKLLLNQGAKPAIQNKNHNSPLDEAISKRYKFVIQLLLEEGTYSYRHQLTQQNLEKFWKDTTLQQDLPFYTTLLLAGVAAPKDQLLPEVLAERKKTIEATIAKWLSPLKLSEEVYRTATPFVLRALPRLLKWTAQIRKLEKAFRKKEKFNTTLRTYEESVQALLWLPQALEYSLLERLYSLPQELLFLVRENLIVKTLLTTLKQCYPELSHEIAVYLLNQVTLNEKACRSFYNQLVPYNGKNFCETPLPTSIQSSSLWLTNS